MRRLLTGLVFFILASPPLAACLCSPPRDVAAGLEESVDVFAGRVEAISHHLLGPIAAVRLRVEASWKGEPTTHRWVLTPYVGDLCGYPFRVGQRYLVYTEPQSMPPLYATPDRPGFRITSVCTRTERLSAAAADRQTLGPPAWTAPRRSGQMHRPRFLEYRTTRRSSRLAFHRAPNSGEVDVLGQPALLLATTPGQLDHLDRLLRTGADPDARGPVDETALMVAAALGQQRAVKLLLRAGADPNAVTSGPASYTKSFATPLTFAAIAGSVPILDQLLASAAAVDGDPRSEASPLIHCARRRHTACVRRLLQAGARRELQDARGKTALDHARRRGDEALIALLKKAAP